MPPVPDEAPGSMLLVEECFSAQDAGFVDALRRVRSAKVLAAFADRWKKDARPWARQQIFAYLDLPLDCPGHQPVLKRLFKQAEENHDTDLLGAFLVAFDTLVRRIRRPKWSWDRELRQGIVTEELSTPRNVIPRDGQTQKVSSYDYTTRRMVTTEVPMRMPRNGRLFNYRTRYYLRRRAWRYFRRLGFSRPAEYPAAIAPALLRYRDDDLARGENILDSWALLNICFRKSDALIFGPAHVQLVEGHALAELKAAPRFAETWESPDGLRVLLRVIMGARSQLVRIWAIELFRRAGSKIELTTEEQLGLLDHSDDRVQQFGAELLATQPGLEKLPVTSWLRLVKTRNLTALGTITELFEKHVTGDRLTLPQVLELTTAKPVPIARLGFRYLQTRSITREEHPALIALAGAQAPAMAGEIGAWALARLGTPEVYDVEVVSRFFDSLVPEMRGAAWTWLVVEGSAGYRDPVLWSRLSETPFDDLRLKLVDHLALRAERRDADLLAPVWCAVLLGVHRGGRQKLKAAHQLGEAIAREPARAPTLLPVLAVAARSSRLPEMRAGLAAVMTLVAQRPELAPVVREKLPELNLGPEGGAA